MRLAAIFAVVVTAAPAFAQSVQLVPFAGYRWGGELSARSSDLFTTDVDVDDSEVWGLMANFRIWEGLGVELFASHQGSELVDSEGLFGGDQPLYDIDVDVFHVGLSWQWDAGTVRPYVVTSLGATRLELDLPGSSDETRLSAGFGGGIDVMPTDAFGVRIDVRGIWTSIDEDDRYWDDDWCDDYWDCGYGYGEDLGQGQVSVGLVFAF